MPEISFRLNRGLLYIPITIVQFGRELHLENCIFDTGSAGTTFDIDEVSTIGIKSTAESKLKRLVTVGGHQTVFTHKIERLILGDNILANVEVEIGNLHSKFGIQGIIGTDIMQLFDWDISFSEKKISLRSG